MDEVTKKAIEEKVGPVSGTVKPKKRLSVLGMSGGILIVFFILLVCIIPAIVGGFVLAVITQVFGWGTWTIWNAFLLGLLIVLYGLIRTVLKW